MWEYLEDRPAFTGNTVSYAKQQVRADCEALRQKRDRELGERAAIGRAKVLQPNLLAALKQVKKLSPSQKARKETGHKSEGSAEAMMLQALEVAPRVSSVAPDVAPELDNQPFLVMELLEGCDLKQALESGPFTPQETLWVLVQLARAVAQLQRLAKARGDLR
jgi:serine/threonine protein kinase